MAAFPPEIAGRFMIYTKVAGMKCKITAGTRIECCGSDAIANWLSGLSGSLAVTTSQAPKKALLGWRGTRFSLLMREFDKPMGLAVGPGKLALATRDEVTLLHDAPLRAPILQQMAIHFWNECGSRSSAL